MLRKKILLSLTLMMWVAIIFMLSSQDYETQSIKPFLNSQFDAEQLAEQLPEISFPYRHHTIDAQTNPIKFIEFLFRKGAHLLLYAMLGGMLMLLLIYFGLKGRYSLIISFCMVGLVASLDEWNQSLNPHRTGSVEDVILDLCGGFIGISLVLGYHLCVKAVGKLRTKRAL